MTRQPTESFTEYIQRYLADREQRELAGNNMPETAVDAAVNAGMLEALVNLVALSRPHFSDSTQILALNLAEAAIQKVRGGQ